MVSYANPGGKISICSKIRENIGKKSFHEENNGRVILCDLVLNDVGLRILTHIPSLASD